MKRMIVVVAGLLIFLALALSPSQPALLAARSAQNATPTPAAEMESTATPAPQAESAPAVVGGDEEPTVTDLLARLESLEATVAELYAAHEAAHVASYTQADAVNSAIYLLDGAGLHGLDVRLNEGGTILPEDAGQMARVARLLTTVDWPKNLAEEAATLHETLRALSTALGEDNLEVAAPLATQAHEEQHDFSHHAQEWLADAVTLELADVTAQSNAVNTAIYLLDSAGLHGLDVRLNEESEILPGDSGLVARVARLLTTVEWPEDLAEEATALYETLSALSTALGEDNLEAAAPLATQAHEEQHDFSHHAQEWLADASGQANRVNTAIYLLDGVDLHALAERLTDEKEILPGDSGEVARLARLLTTVDWPDALVEDASALHETLSALATALTDDNLEAATPLAEVAHDAQHDFSELAQEWLSQMNAGAEGDD